MASKVICTVKNAALICVIMVALVLCWRSIQWIPVEENTARRATNTNGPELLSLEPTVPVQIVQAIDDIDQPNLRRIIKPLEYPLATYMRALQGSVQILHTPRGKLVKQATTDCQRYPQPPFIEHQHSLELRFPYVLGQMQLIAEKHGKSEYHFLHRNSTYSEPLFYFLQSHQYFIVYCSYSPRNKESWDAGERYITSLAKYTINTEEFKRNTGTDFMVPASHPKSGPIGVKYPEKSTYQRQAFLRTDMDWNGYIPKDIIVPYYVPTTVSTRSAALRSSGTDHTPARETSLLLFFAGGRNPPGGLREQLEAALTAVITTDKIQDILFTTSPISREQFNQGLGGSLFCASVRGDTASSSRLFAIIEAGCIPVIISDWLPLPFEKIIDYTAFSVRFPESIVHNPRQLIAHLRGIPTEQIRSMQQALRTARPMLIYPEMDSAREFHLLNPVTLTLVEMIMRRKEYCDGLQYANRKGTTQKEVALSSGTINSSDMCIKLFAQIKDALRSQ